MAKVGVGETFAEMVLAICVLSSDLGGTPSSPWCKDLNFGIASAAA